MPAAEECRGHFDSDRGYKSESARILDAGGDDGQRVTRQKRQKHGGKNPEDQKLLLECHLIPQRLGSAPVGPRGLTGTEANVTWWSAAPVWELCCRWGGLC